MKTESHLGAYLNILLLAAFLFSSVLIITQFTTIDKASWLIDGSHIIIGIILIFLGGVLLRVYIDSGKKSILYLAVGFLVLAFGRLVAIYAQEYMLSATVLLVPYNLLFFYSTTQTIGVIFLFLGFAEVISSRKVK